MKLFRIFLPIYKKIIKKLSRGKGYGKNETVRRVMSFFNLVFRSDDVEVNGHKMFLTKKGFDEYSMEGVYGEFDTNVVEKLVKPGEHVIDVGAAIGYYTLILCRAVKENGRVFAFEPKKDRFDVLKKNMLRNGYSNVKIENKAVLENNGKANFTEAKREGVGLGYVEDYNKNEQTRPILEIDAVSLDDYIKKNSEIEKISFMKIDVDGPEFLVLKSSKELLKNDKMKIFMEWDNISARRCGIDPSQVIDILIQNNFKMFYPNYEKNKFFEISKNQLMDIPDKLDLTINMLFVKNADILEESGLIQN